MYSGTIEDVLAAGEYDQGDFAAIDYDELHDLVDQAKLFKALWQRERQAHNIFPVCDTVDVNELVQRKTNRPLHPVLGGESPYTGFPKL